MVISYKENTAGESQRQGVHKKVVKSSKINSSTRYDLCSEKLTAFGGLFALVKFLDVVDFERLFHAHFKRPERNVELGYYKMVVGPLMLLFIGFQRIGHFGYIRTDAIVCGILDVVILPAVSTFWRFLQSLGINQSRSLLHLMGAVRGKVWELCNLQYRSITVNIDTTVCTVYGLIQGARKGHNARHRGKKGLRPVFAFIGQTREYLHGFQRRGTTVSGREVARLIREMGYYLPPTVSDVLIRADGEFISWDSVSECLERGYCYIFGIRNYKPPFNARTWYRYGEYEYNEVVYTPHGWALPCRFVAMRISREKLGDRQLTIFDEDNYVYRIFVTNLKTRPHNVIRNYDKRADVENSIKEAQHEGILAVPSKKIQSNHAFFQIAMLAYNLWRWMKPVAGHCYEAETEGEKPAENYHSDIVDATIRISRLKTLYIPAKIVTHSDKTKIRYSVHDTRSAEIIDFLKYLDRRRREKRKSNTKVTYYIKAG